MGSRIAYYRVSSADQSIEAQRAAMGGGFEREFVDENVSGLILAADRPGFSALLNYVREGDTLCVFAVDRLGRDALDIQFNVRRLIKGGVTVDVLGLGPVVGEVGELILAVLAQLAEIDRRRIKQRCDSGRLAARQALAATGKTHKGKASLGRPPAADSASVVEWRKANGASIKATADHWKLSLSTVKRYCAA